MGYLVDWKRQRRDFLAAESALREQHPHRGRWSTPITSEIIAGSASPRAPGMLWAIGETGIANLSLAAEAHAVQVLTEQDRQRIRTARRLFPEANVRTIHTFDLPFAYGEMVGEPE